MTFERMTLATVLALLAAGCTRQIARPPNEATRDASSGCIAGTVAEGGSRLVPEIRNGRAAGWRFYEVAPDLVRIGVVKGDVLVGIDDHPPVEFLNQCLDGALLKIHRNGREILLRHLPR
jgi:hypothetical protein